MRRVLIVQSIFVMVTIAILITSQKLVAFVFS